ncbi:MAG TPA: acyltransferase [Xanthobacteraceae bacterium]|nr:acyltransferase [Xanthobacteraceae bacterium]
MRTTGRSKLIELEGLRGVAAMIVLFHHFLLFVAPRLHGRNFPDDPIALVRTPLFALVNGSAAVAIFFVLSGFVLTLSAMEKRDWRALLVGALKRWPRLVPLVVTVNMLSAVFFLLGLYRDDGWFNLARYLGAGGFEQGASVIRGALAEGVFSTFVYGKTDFNAALWTMHYELFGSFAAYATGLILIFQKSLSRAMAVGAVATVVTATMTGEGGFYYAMLVAGVIIARAYIERGSVASALSFIYPWRMPIILGTACLAVVLCGYDGYSKPVGFYSFMAGFASPQIEPLVHGVAAAALLVLVLFCDPVRRRLVGPTARLLGRLSFPIYLVHLPILHGLVAPIHSGMAARFGGIVAAPAAFVLLMVLVLAAAYPLAYLDEWWICILRAGLGGRQFSVRLSKQNAETSRGAINSSGMPTNRSEAGDNAPLSALGSHSPVD